MNYDLDSFCEDTEEDIACLVEHCYDVEGDAWKWEENVEFGFE